MAYWRIARRLCASAFALITLVSHPVAVAGEVEVFHYWDFGSDLRALTLLRSDLVRKGHSWKDFARPGPEKVGADARLRARVLAGDPPTAAHVRMGNISQWSHLNVLANMDDVAKAEHWDTRLPKAISAGMKVNGSYVAVPLSVHRVNWLWINNKVLAKSGARVPRDWAEFFVTAEAMKKAGFIALANGNQSFQDFNLFENVALGVGGPDFFRKAFVERDSATLTGPVMERVLMTYKRIKPYTEHVTGTRDWTFSSSEVLRGQAGMQIMADWAKPVYLDAQRKTAFDFSCVPAPGTSGMFSFSVDAFAMFKMRDRARQQGQRDLAITLLSPDIQRSFNRDKGSIPVRLDVDMAGFDTCAVKSAADFRDADRQGTLVPSVAMSVPADVEETMRDVVSSYWHDDRMSAKTAMARLDAAAHKNK